MKMLAHGISGKQMNRMAKLMCFYRQGTLLCDKVTEEAEGVCYAVSNQTKNNGGTGYGDHACYEE